MYKLHEDKTLPVFSTVCFMNFAGLLNPTRSVVEIVVFHCYSAEPQTSSQ